MFQSRGRVLSMCLGLKRAVMQLMHTHIFRKISIRFWRLKARCRFCRTEAVYIKSSIPMIFLSAQRHIYICLLYTSYCHPYSSYERGSNENQNKLIRRHIPKGVNFDGKTSGEIKEMEDWINNYPRALLNWRTSEECYQEEVKKLFGIA